MSADPKQKQNAMPDLKTFLSDPQFQGDREFFFGLFNEYEKQRDAAVAAKKAEEEKTNPPTFLQRMFDKT